MRFCIVHASGGGIGCTVCGCAQVMQRISGRTRASLTRALEGATGLKLGMEKSTDVIATDFEKVGLVEGCLSASSSAS
jgi:hypothetical protein